MMKFCNASLGWLLGVATCIIAACDTPAPIAGQDEISEPLTVVLKLVKSQTWGIQLDAPSECEVGELVRFDARESDVDALVWRIRPESDDFETVDGNRRAFFSARTPGKYLISIAGAKAGKAFLLQQTLTVNGLATPETNLASDIRQWLNMVPDFPEKEAQTLAMSEVFSKLATSDTDLDTMLTATALANSAVIGKDFIDQWVPFLDKLGTELDRLDASHQLDSREAYRMKWLEIATALKRFARE